MDQRESFQDLTGTTKTFYDGHGVQLLGMEFPPKTALLEQLDHKLRNQIYDAGDFFEVIDNQVEGTFVVQTKQPIKAFSQVFIIDHFLSFKYNDLHEKLSSNSSAIERLDNMLKYWRQRLTLPGDQKKGVALCTGQEEFDEMQIEDPNSVGVKTSTITLSFYGNLIKDSQLVTKMLTGLPHLKALWLNENPIQEVESLLEHIETSNPNIELFNSNFTKNAGQWAFKFVTFGNDLQKVQNVANSSIRHLNLSGRNVLRIGNLSKILQQEFQSLRSLDIRETQLTDLEETNRFLAILQDCKIKYLQCDLQIEHILQELKQNNKLDSIAKHLRLVNSRDLNSSVVATEQTQVLQDIKTQVFRLAGCYRLLSAEQMDEQAVWYVMDELGSFIQHSDHPNVKVMPLLYLPNGVIDDHTISYSLLWPIRDLAPSEPIYRDYLAGITESQFRSARLSVWFDVPFDKFTHLYLHHKQDQLEQTKRGKAILSQVDQSSKTCPFFSPDQKLRILTDNDLLEQYLTLPQVEFTKELEDCDLIFFNSSLQDELSRFLGKWINQFPSEMSIVAKDNLAFNVQSCLGQVPWLQDTYNLKAQLPVFLGRFHEAERLCKENTWIIKPPNMARSMDMVVTNSLDIIIRMLETGPKLAQKYIHRPLTLRNKKIDLRYVVLLRSIDPLEVFLYKVFFIRTANIDFTMDVNSYTLYENHFTVMNYGQKLTQIHFSEFIEEFQRENPSVKWADVHSKIVQMVRELFVAVKHNKPEMHSEKSRAIYGMDVMVSLPDYQPKLLEMTFSPDCNRACKYHPTFYNDIFECLFFGKENDNIERVI